MTPISYFKLQAKNLFKDFKTKKPVFDKAVNDYLYEYEPTYFDIDRIVIDFDLNEEKFTLMNAQHIIAYLAGYRKWTELIKAPEEDLKLAKLLFENQDKIFIEEWIDYIGGVEHDNNTTLDTTAKIEIFQEVFINSKGHNNPFGDFRINQKSE